MKTSNSDSFLKQKALWSFGCLISAWCFYYWSTLVSIFYSNQIVWVNWAVRGIVIATLLLVYFKRQELRNNFFISSQLGLLVLFITAVGYVLGNVFNITYVEQTAVMLMVPALVTTCFGPAVVRTLIFPILYLMLVIPMQDNTLHSRDIIVSIAAGLFLVYLYKVLMQSQNVVETGQRSAWTFQSSRWLLPTAIAFGILMVSPWLSDNIRSFYPKKKIEFVLRAPLGINGWSGPAPVKVRAWEPYFPNASALLQAKYFSKLTTDRDGVYLFTAYYDSNRTVNDLMDSRNVLFDPKLWKSENPKTIRVDVGNDESESVLEVILKAGAVSRVAWYWYYVAGVSTTDPSLVTVLDGVRVISKYAQGSGMVFISTSYTESPEEARVRLSSFMSGMYSSLDTLRRPEIHYSMSNQKKGTN